MKSYLGLISEYAKVHKKKNRLTITCIAVSVLLVAAVFGMAEMSVKTQMIEQIKTYGNYHAVVSNPAPKIAEQIGSRPDVAVSGWVYEIESGRTGDLEVRISGGDEAMSREMNMEAVEGRFPEALDEIMMDRSAMQKLGYAVGDTVDITLADGSAGKFKITGISSDFVSLKSFDRHGVYFSTVGIQNLPSENVYSAYYIQFKKGANIRQAIEEIKTDYGLSKEQVGTNRVLIGLLGQGNDSGMYQLYLVAGILFVLILCAGTFMISSSFTMRVTERVQFFGMMRCLGATKKQVRRYVRLEGLRLCVVGIPIGLLAGTLMMWAAAAYLKFFNSAFFAEMPLFQISVPALLAGAGVGFLTVMLASNAPCKKAAGVSPQAALTGSLRGMKTVGKAANTRIFHVETGMGVNHAFQSGKNTFLLSGSFAISIVLFLCFTVLITFMNHALNPLRPYAPDISALAEENAPSIKHDLAGEISELAGVKKTYGRMFAYDIPVTGREQVNTAMLISHEQYQFDWVEDQLIEGDIEDARDGDGVLVIYSEEQDWHVGDTILVNLPKGETSLRVAGILADAPYDRAAGEQAVICSEKTFTALTGSDDYTIIDIQVNANAPSDLDEKIRELAGNQISLLDKRIANRDVQAAYLSMSVFVYGFLMVIAFVALLNIVNTVNGSVSSRMNQYGMMRAVGMSARQLKRMVWAEAASYAVVGSIAGCVLGLLCHKMVFTMMVTENWGVEWQPPLLVLAVTIAASAITTFIAVISPSKKIEKLSIVNVVNAQQ